MGGMQLLIYISFLVLIVGTIIRAVKIAKMPMHLRWELYPVPHEKGKAHYGGSYFEEPDWWTRPLKTSFISEIREMGREIFFIQSLYHNNRSLWLFSFPFHLGLYFTVGFVALLILSAILNLLGLFGPAVQPMPAPQALQTVTDIFGVLGIFLGGLGAFGLLLSRIFRTDLRKYSGRSDYFNLLFIVVLYVSCFISWYSLGGSFGVYRDLTYDLVAFRSLTDLPAAVALNLTIFSFFLIYLPFTHMTHFVGKYFTYHKVRWQDEPNVRGGRMEREIAEILNHKLTWSGGHIKSGTSWAEAASGAAGASEEDGK
jgi:nitrate reductase gamma subunit